MDGSDIRVTDENFEPFVIEAESKEEALKKYLGEYYEPDQSLYFAVGCVTCNIREAYFNGDKEVLKKASSEQLREEIASFGDDSQEEEFEYQQAVMTEEYINRGNYWTE